MSMTDTPTLDQVLLLAQKLPVGDKLRLIERLAPQIAAVLPTAQDSGDVWDDFMRFSDELIQLPPPAQDSAVLLSSMRR